MMTENNPDPFEILKLAASSYSKFSDDDVQSAFFKLLHAVADDVESRDYEPSDTTDDLAASLVDAMNAADAEAEDDLGGLED